MSYVDRTPASADDPSTQLSDAVLGFEASRMTATEPVRPVVRMTTSAPGSRPRAAWRWAVALFATAFMVMGTLGIAAFAQTSRFGAGDGPSFLPATAVAYAELRLDLPGDQRDELIGFLSHLPGFADPASFDTKLDQTLDQLLGGSGSPISWTEDVKPWFGGQVMVGVPAVPEMSTTSSGAEAVAAAVFALGVTDRDALDAALAKLLGTMGDDVTTEEYGGTTISSMGDDGSVTVVAPTDTLLLFGNDVGQVKAAIDILGGSEPSLADDPDFQAAIAAMPADRLGAFVIDTEQLKTVLGPLLADQLAAQPQMAAMVPQIEAVLASLPGTFSGHIRVESDHLTLRLDALAAPDAVPGAAVRQTDLAQKAPADSIVYLETRDVGSALQGILVQVKPLLAQQGNEQAMAQIEALLGTSLESYLDWVGDVAISASLGEAGPSVGLVATVTDEAVGQQRIDSLLTLVRVIAGTADPSPVEITQEDVNGVTVTSIALTGDAAASADLPVEPRISVALADGHFYLGLGDFAAEALAREPADSLAATPDYAKALDAAGAENAGMVYLDVASALSYAELLMSSDQREQFETQVMPYAEVLDFVVASLNQDAASSSASLQLFVK